MDHASCQAAIKTYVEIPSDSNVAESATDCQCRYDENIAACDWVGNGIKYACLTSTAGDAPHRVLYGFSAKSPKLSPRKFS
jgi:hypothetical protein